MSQGLLGAYPGFEGATSINNLHMINLRLPLRNIQVNQPFGVNYLDFYKKLGLAGHNGVDFRAYTGFKIYAAHAGTVLFAGTYPDKTIAIELWDKVQKIKTVYYHLEKLECAQGDFVAAGQIIGTCDNTGIYTTGDHLHFGLKMVDDNGNTQNYDNGFKGAIDPTPYFTMAYDGTPIGNKDCYKSNAYHRYYRGRPKGGLINEMRIVKELIPYLKRLPTNEEINACTYGGWNREVLKNIAMRDLWAFLKRSEYEAGKKPFQD